MLRRSMTHLAIPLTSPSVERRSDKTIFAEDARNACSKLSMRALMIYLWYLDSAIYLHSHLFLSSIRLFL